MPLTTYLQDYEIDLLEEIYEAPKELKELYKTIREHDNGLLIKKYSFETKKWYQRNGSQEDNYTVFKRVGSKGNEYQVLMIPNELLSLTELYSYLYGRLHGYINGSCKCIRNEK